MAEVEVTTLVIVPGLVVVAVEAAEEEAIDVVAGGVETEVTADVTWTIEAEVVVLLEIATEGPAYSRTRLL